MPAASSNDITMTQTRSWSSSTECQPPEVRRRMGSTDEEAPPPNAPMSAEEQHLRSIVQSLFCLDLKAAHTVTEDFTREERLANIEPHFKDLWESPPPLDLIEKWINSDELYHSHEVMYLESFREYLASLSYEQLVAAVKNNKANLYYVRMLLGRIWKFQEQKTIKGLAERDLRGSFEINLGLLIGERPTSEADYLKRLTQKQLMSKVRLSRILSDARLLRDQITEAFQQGGLDEDLLQSLRQRIGALQEHYDEAWKLLDQKQNDKLLDHKNEEWFLPRQIRVIQAKTRTDPATLAFLAFFFSFFAGYPAWIAWKNTPGGRGSWDDAGFSALLAGSILQLLGLGTQILGPLLLPRIFHTRLDTEEKTLVWIIALLTFVCTCGSVLSYGFLSAQFSGFIGFAGQAMMGLVQLMMVFGV